MAPDRSILEGFIQAGGLRRTEREQVRCTDIREDEQGYYWVHVAAQKDHLEQDVPVIDDWAVIELLQGDSFTPDLDREYNKPPLEEAKEGRSADELLFPFGIPLNLEVDPLRYRYAWLLYSGIIEAQEAVFPETFHEAALLVKHVMGWKRMDFHFRLWRRRVQYRFLLNGRQAGMIPEKEGYVLCRLVQNSPGKRDLTSAGRERGEEHW